MKKSKLFLTGILAAALVFGLVLTGCPIDGGNSGVGEELPAASGENRLSGKTYFRYYEKIEFAADKTYKKLEVKRDDEGTYVVTDGKYTCAKTEIENGNYSWDESSKYVIF
jgi:hypothetical protein